MLLRRSRGGGILLLPGLTVNRVSRGTDQIDANLSSTLSKRERDSLNAVQRAPRQPAAPSDTGTDMTMSDELPAPHPESAASAIREHLDGSYALTLMNDIALDTIPTHLTGSRVFLVTCGGRSEVVKLGPSSEIRAEAETLTTVGRHLAEIPTELSMPVRIPTYHEVRDFDGNKDVLALITSFHGVHTLEVYRVYAGEPEQAMQGIIRRLGQCGILWPACIARNVVVQDPTSSRSALYLIDWERSWTRPDKARTSQTFYQRSIELLEEASTTTAHGNILPYWSAEWPSADRLREWKEERPMQHYIHLAGHSDRRFRAMMERLDLPARVTDAQFFRLMEVFSDASERARTVSSLIYAADQISGCGGCFDLRVAFTILSWHLRRHSPVALAVLQCLLMATARRIHLAWRTIPLQEEARTAIKGIEAEARRRLGTDLGYFSEPGRLNEVENECRDFILEGRSLPPRSIRVLYNF